MREIIGSWTFLATRAVTSAPPRPLRLCSVFVVLAITASVLAHDGPRVWLDQSAGQVVTLTSDNDLSPTMFMPARVFQGSFEQLFGVWTTEFPGYEVRSIGGSVPAGTIFGFRLAGPLLMLDLPSDALLPVQQIFGPPAGPGPVPQLAASADTSFRITGNSPVDGFDFFQYFGGGDHAHLSFTLLGDGVSPASSPPPDGAYVLPLISTSDSLASSEWYFIVFGKNATTPQRDRATTLAGQMASALPGDANFDGTVGIADFARLGANFNTSDRWWGDGDFNFDGIVNITDFSLLAANFNLSSSRSPGIVPEPGAAGLLAVVFGGMAHRRWRRRVP